MKYTIDELQSILSLTDKELCNKLNIRPSMLKKMKERNERADYYKIKNTLAFERARLIKYLQ